MLRLMYFATLASRWVYISKRTRLTLLVPEMDKRFILRLGYPLFYSSQYFNENSQVGELFKGICRLLYEVCASQQLQGGACFVHQVSLSL
ncbi:hypothetical protein HanXRQr2_Chr06g0249571 [Helianthus annuus]|nr:hypothetical protein HanXRQr2_Chr06g0249571 [Helianthus annuus]